jgi:hypothetical protein
MRIKRFKRARRKRVLQIRFSNGEWAKISKTFPPRKIGTAMRALALWREPPFRSPMLEVRRELLLQLARIGNNLNQVAKGINLANLAGNKVDAVRVLAKLAEIQEAIEKL